MLKKTAWVMGLSIIASSFSLLASGVYGVLLYDRGYVTEEYPAIVMLLSGLLYIAVGRLLYELGRGVTIKTRDALAATVLVWILIPLLDAVPFMIAIHIPFIDAAFESVSGWTTTGLTILTGQPSSWHHIYVPDVNHTPQTLLIWRTLMQWEGGLGIVILTIAILAPPGVSAAVLYLAEGKFEKLEASFKRTAVIMGLIYVILTFAGVLMFLATGMNLYDAINHAMTGVATAGFSTHDASLGYYYNLGKHMVLVAGMIVMMSGAISFSDHYNLLRGNIRALKDSIELQTQILIIVVSSLFALYIWHIDPGFHKTYTPLLVVFHVVSAFATAGFQSGNLHIVPESYKVLLAVLSIIGGSAFSTAGGIKVLRFVISVKSIGMEAGLSINPPGYVPRRKIGKYHVDEDLVRKTLATTAAFILAYTVLVMLLSGLNPQYDLGDVIFEVASAMGNVGLSAGISAAAATTSAKLILIAAMLLGRLEVITYLIVLKMAFSRKL